MGCRPAFKLFDEIISQQPNGGTVQYRRVVFLTGISASLYVLSMPRTLDFSVAEGSCDLNPRILIVDDHAFLRRGVESFIVDNRLGTVCGEAADGEEAVRKTTELQPDLIIMDVSMPKLGGIDATRQIRKFAPTIKIIILTMHQSSQMALIAKQAGANCLVEKTEVSEKLACAIRQLFDTQ